MRVIRTKVGNIGVRLWFVGAVALAGCAADGVDETSATGSTGSYLVMTRPPSVPAEYVVTPNGYFHPDCVQEVNEDETLRSEGAVHRIERLDGSDGRDIVSCQHPRFDARGALVAAESIGTEGAVPDGDLDAAAATKPAFSGWIESANSTAVGPASYLHAQWNIPAAPATKTNQTVYFFPGLEHAGGTTTILQPVLGWNAGGGIAGWSLASWNCCKDGTTQHSGFIPAPGSTVSGDVGGTNCNSAGVCSKWQVVSYDWSSQRSTTLNTSAFGLTMNWIFGGVLEAYNIGSCSQLPGGTVTFSAFHVNNANGTHVATPAWHHDVGSVSPACGYSITQSGSNVILHY
jgi:hypothetical protein